MAQINHHIMTIGTSPAFEGGRRYGSISVSYPWATVKNEYLVSRGKLGTDTDQLQYRCLGSVRYKQEICYYVMICLTEDAAIINDAGDFPRIVDEGGGFRPFAAFTDTSFKWACVTTTVNRPSILRNLDSDGSVYTDNNITWSHLSMNEYDTLSLGFYFPAVGHAIRLPKLELSISFLDAGNFVPGGGGSATRPNVLRNLDGIAYNLCVKYPGPGRNISGTQADTSSD